jgi:hypothetical protein
MKWNFQTKEYEDYFVPKNWKVCAYIDDLNSLINCASCGKSIIAGDTYTSRQIQGVLGFGYMVCEDCYSKEREEESRAK